MLSFVFVLFVSCFSRPIFLNPVQEIQVPFMNMNKKYVVFLQVENKFFILHLIIWQYFWAKTVTCAIATNLITLQPIPNIFLFSSPHYYFISILNLRRCCIHQFILLTQHHYNRSICNYCSDPKDFSTSDFIWITAVSRCIDLLQMPMDSLLPTSDR